MVILKRVLVVAMLALVANGCGGREQATQPSPVETSFEPGKFDDLPIYPRSEPLSGRNEKDGVVSRSYRSRGTSPQALLDFYADNLESVGWEPSNAANPSGSQYRGDWITDEYHLEVTAGPIDDRQNPTSDDYTIQYNLVLRPR